MRDLTPDTGVQELRVAIHACSGSLQLAVDLAADIAPDDVEVRVWQAASGLGLYAHRDATEGTRVQFASELMPAGAYTVEVVTPMHGVIALDSFDVDGLHATVAAAFALPPLCALAFAASAEVGAPREFELVREGCSVPMRCAAETQPATEADRSGCRYNAPIVTRTPPRSASRSAMFAGNDARHPGNACHCAAEFSAQRVTTTTAPSCQERHTPWRLPAPPTVLWYG